MKTLYCFFLFFLISNIDISWPHPNPPVSNKTWGLAISSKVADLTTCSYLQMLFNTSPSKSWCLSKGWDACFQYQLLSNSSDWFTLFCSCRLWYVVHYIIAVWFRFTYHLAFWLCSQAWFESIRLVRRKMLNKQHISISDCYFWFLLFYCL